MIYHLIVGDMAAQPLLEAVASEASLQGEVVVLRDILHVGPLQKGEGQTFSGLRSNFWNEAAPNEKAPVEVNDMERILEVSAAMFKDENIQAWFWMAPAPADVCAYHWLLRYLGKHSNRFFLVNIAGLPFLNEAGKVFYPKGFGEILPKEIIKARRLARIVTPAELEVDGDEWNKLVEQNTGLRTHEGGKKLLSRGEDYYDAQLLSFCSGQYQKASRIVSQALGKYGIPTGDLWLAWRLRQLAASGQLQLQGDATKTLKDWEIKLPGDTPSASEPSTAASPQNNNA